MAVLAGSFAVTHAPLIVREWDRLPSVLRNRLDEAYHEVGRRITAARPDVLLVVAPDHWVNFFIDNMPTICLGIGEEHVGPPEPFLKHFARSIPGHPALANHLLTEALAADFEPSASHHLVLDHGICLPLDRFGLSELPPVIPVVINGINPPLMSINRALQWGRQFARSIASYPENLRVVIVGTGGLSHSIGEPTMGTIDTHFDDACIRAFDLDDRGLVSTIERSLRTTGNGGHEVRDWVVIHGASRGGFELIDYVPAREVYTGCAFAEWAIA
jgi:aromatic ring-opening dioxygenase catalytic subunit (LigB family)